MRIIVAAFLFLISFSSISQSKVDFREIDYAVLSVKSSSVDSLSYHLTKPYNTELEKVRSIFRWITENIAYNSKTYLRPARNAKRTIEEDTSTVYKTLNERVAEEVVRKKVAVCDGYAKLFKTRCDKAGIKSEVITGYGRTDMNRPGTKFRSNHSWNAVYIDSAWHLLDATWASGYFYFNSTDFIKHFDDYYFLTPPEEFIKSHYPEDPKWTLLKNPPTLREFEYSPFKYMAFTKYKIADFKPLNGVIEARVGDTLSFEIEIDVSGQELKIAPDYYYNLSDTSLSNTWAFIKPSSHISKKKAYYTYIVEAPEKEWLHIVYNDDVIMQYRLKIRKEEGSLLKQNHLAIESFNKDRL